MSPQLDERLHRLKTELDDHSRIATFLGLDFERPIKSLGDGYPENAISWVGKITERILKQLWRHHDVPGDPSGKSLSELIKGCQTHIASGAVLDALRDIQRLRNRSAHDGYEIAEEDGLTAVRRLLDVLVWFTSTGSVVLTGDVPRLTPLVAKKAEFLAGLYLTLDFRPVKRFELSQHTVYQLFSRETGLRTEYVELLLTRHIGELHQVLRSTGGELLQTRLPKLTRFLVVDEQDEEAEAFEDYRVVTYDRFMETVVDVDAHLDAAAEAHPALGALPAPERLPIAADLLTTDERSGEMALSRLGDAMDLLGDVALTGGNVLVVGRSGSGKSTLLKRLVADGRDADVRRYRFYFDMSLKRKDESFRDFVTRTLADCMSVETSRVFDVFHYFARSGSVVCALDGIDEAVHETTLTGFLDLFAELAEILSAESAVVMSSRVSFLEDSPEVRRLLDGTALMSEKLVQHLHAQGVDPLKIPRFSALHLHDVDFDGDGTDDGSPLELRLSRMLGHEAPLPDLLWTHLEQAVADAGIPEQIPQLVDYFGGAALQGRTTFTLIDVCNALGIGCFEGGRIAFEAFKLWPLFRPAGDERIAFTHSAYQELLAAEHLRRDRPASGSTLSAQTRAFLHHRSRNDDTTDDCVLPAGTYLVGPSHHLMLRTVERPVRFDRYAVTVGRYKRFLAAVERDGSAEWDHPDMPPDQTHQPWRERLAVPDYYDDPAYDDHPAVCINWWNAYAFARFEGKRLPTSLEWEAAARGADGRLFPWGDDLDLEAVNCADTWSGRPLVTYEVWKEELDRGGLRDATRVQVDANPRNRSPFGIRQMVGNVWELTSTVIEETGDIVMCGGSYDNPYRAVQTSSKGLYRRRGASNVVGFRCVEDLG
ncbi:SUMF1/EgtB/PvdO family nonheme iron enzyme [Actinoallomurus soli]|uniref:SUMF1/EgtB/PvdO family nonheme iron enzyme n=1 Tax=Actinoallomurus soli TaxID=2952535 RepID=UPI002092F726|nr:SUMF1/EgtB/PvdO family nonheme iron enzyme [Actinoallomurus soli]MCO5968925.1 SUMF1/EgtB/PvdO family nonheme iron enzyme [Actinoallomurus soli]